MASAYHGNANVTRSLLITSMFIERNEQASSMLRTVDIQFAGREWMESDLPEDFKVLKMCYFTRFNIEDHLEYWFSLQSPPV
jgi:hypothetical protein